MPDEMMEQPSAPSLETIRINGEVFQVTPEVAEALAQRENDFNRKLSAQGQELGQLRQAVQALNMSVEREQKHQSGTDPDLEWFRSPSAVMEAQLRQQREEIIHEVSTRYQQEMNRQQFWGAFYRNNPELNAHDWIVQAVLQNHWASLSQMETDLASRELARLTKERIASLTKSTGNRVEVPQGGGSAVRTQSTGYAPPQADTVPQTDGNESYSLSEIIAKRRMQREKARLKL